jgi:hypothetical protein
VGAVCGAMDSSVACVGRGDSLGIVKKWKLLLMAGCLPLLHCQLFFRASKSRALFPCAADIMPSKFSAVKMGDSILKAHMPIEPFLRTSTTRCSRRKSFAKRTRVAASPFVRFKCFVQKSKSDEYPRRAKPRSACSAARSSIKCARFALS